MRKILFALSILSVVATVACKKNKTEAGKDKEGSSTVGIKYEREDAGVLTDGNLSVGKFYKFSRQPVLADKFPLEWSDGALLTDELLGENNAFSTSNYVGWDGTKPVEITIDLGRIQTLNKVHVNGLLSVIDNIKEASLNKVSYKIKNSDNWINYTGTLSKVANNSQKGSYQLFYSGADVQARYVKVSLEPNSVANSRILLDEINLLGKIKNSNRSVPQNGAFHGAFPTPNGFTPAETGGKKMVINLFEELVGKKIAMVLWYQGMKSGRKFSEMSDLRIEFLNKNYQGVRHFMFGWEPNDVPLKDIADGGLDAYFTEYFKDSMNPTVLGGIDAPVFFRPMNEFNADWVNWSGNPQMYRRAWRRMYNIAEQLGAANKHIFVWSANYLSFPNVEWNKMQNFYPGDQYVDWVGISAYPPGAHLTAEENRYPATVVKEAYDLYANYKPFMITEGGFSESSDMLRWTKGWFELKNTHPKIKALIWENHNDRKIALHPEALKLYKEKIQDDYWLSETNNLEK